MVRYDRYDSGKIGEGVDAMSYHIVENNEEFLKQLREENEENVEQFRIEKRIKIKDIITDFLKSSQTDLTLYKIKGNIESKLDRKFFPVVNYEIRAILHELEVDRIIVCRKDPNFPDYTRWELI